MGVMQNTQGLGSQFSNSNAPGVYLSADYPVNHNTFNPSNISNNYDLIKMNLLFILIYSHLIIQIHRVEYLGKK